IYTLTLNPALDYFVQVENYQSGQVNRASQEKLLAGGKGLNVSTVLHHLGTETIALGFLAGYTGAIVSALLKQSGVPQDFILLPQGNTRINIKLHAQAKNETEINGIGAPVDENSMQELYKKLDMIQENDYFVLAGSIPDTMSDNIYCDIMQRYQEKNIKFVVDSSGEVLKKALAYRPFLIKPNHHELGELFGVKLHKPTEVIKYAKKLQEWGASNILVSMAEKGAVLICENGEVYQQRAFKGEVINSAGAGDSMLAGFLTAYSKTGSLEQSLNLGIASGSASTFSETLATKEQIFYYYKKFAQLDSESC
ncbi:MAG: 1-phosphofructokinase, partial [Oscillospiraceae bacterium]|nr:1-phosphofructokinase [Oscillospiraceae bacterium]